MTTFDDMFNFSQTKVYLDNKISILGNSISDINTNISVLGNISGHDAMANIQISYLTTQKSEIEQNQGNLISIRSEIDSVESLSSGDKTILFDFYGNIIGNIEPDIVFMERMLFNSTSGNLVVDANGLIQDGALNASERQLIGEGMCKHYEILPMILSSNEILPMLKANISPREFILARNYIIET